MLRKMTYGDVLGQQQQQQQQEQQQQEQRQHLQCIDHNIGLDSELGWEGAHNHACVNPMHLFLYKGM